MESVKKNRLSQWFIIGISIVMLAGVFNVHTPAVKAAIQATYYVSPSGNDANPGTLAQPFKTITKARDKVRTMNSNMTGDIVVYLLEGDYYQDNTIVFNESDSGSNGHNVIYQNYDAPGSARIIGGEKLTGWTQHDGNVYKVYVGTSRSINSLFENGESSKIARYPNTGYSKVSNHDQNHPKKAFYYSGSIPAIADISDLEVYIWPGRHNWANEILPVAAINRNNQKITLTENQRWPYLGSLIRNSRYFIQGAIELLDQPGEFYMEKSSGYLYYYPKNGGINNQEIIVPKVDTVILLNGSSNENRVANIQFDGLTISVSDSSYLDMNTGKTGNIVLINSENITITNSRILHSNSNGISMPSTDLQTTPVKSRGMSNTIYGNYIHDVGDSGVRITGTPQTANYMQTDHLVSNNKINDIARVSTNGAGIQLANTTNAEASYNEITHATHYGIEVKGSKWTSMPAVIEGITVTEENRYDFNPGRYNVIKFNDISNVNRDTQDTGIFKSGGTYQTTIDNNRLHDSGRLGLQKGLYLDDVSDYGTVTNNIVYGLSGNTKINYNIKGIGNVVQNNISDGTGGAKAVQFNIIGNQPTELNKMISNIFINSAIFYNFSSWKNNRVTVSDYNTFYRQSGVRTFNNIPGADTYSNWRNILNNKFDQHSNTTNPQFVDAANHDYTLPENSPLLTRSVNPFVQIDQASIGLKGDYIYTDTPGGGDPNPDPDPDPEPTFFDGFENGFDQWTTVYGTPTASTNQAHTDNYSYFPDQGRDQINHAMDGETYGILSVWFYDNANDHSMKVRAGVNSSTTSENAMIGVVTYESTNKYSYSVNAPNWVISSVNRTTGWHEFKFDFSSGQDCKLYIDDILIGTTDIITSFDEIYLGDNGNDNNTGNVYFDDVTLDESP